MKCKALHALLVKTSLAFTVLLKSDFLRHLLRLHLLQMPANSTPVTCLKFTTWLTLKPATRSVSGRIRLALHPSDLAELAEHFWFYFRKNPTVSGRDIRRKSSPKLKKTGSTIIPLAAKLKVGSI